MPAYLFTERGNPRNGDRAVIIAPSKQKAQETARYIGMHGVLAHEITTIQGYELIRVAADYSIIAKTEALMWTLRKGAGEKVAP